MGTSCLRWKSSTPLSIRNITQSNINLELNRTCYNGLCRISSTKGEFNAPKGWQKKKGDYVNSTICDRSNLENVSRVHSTISATDYVKATENMQRGDFVYLDPPYDPKSYTSNFTAYTKNGFGRKDQEQLASVCRKLIEKGCKVLLSNSDTPFIRELYPKTDFNIEEVETRRDINCKASKRKGHKELIISNYLPTWTFRRLTNNYIYSIRVYTPKPFLSKHLNRQV